MSPYKLHNCLYAFQFGSRGALDGILPFATVHRNIGPTLHNVNAPYVCAFQSASLAKESEHVAARHLVLLALTYI